MSRLASEITIDGKTIPVPVTTVDQIVNFFDPAKGQARFQHRLRMAISGAYAGADRTRRANQAGIRRERDADAAIIPDLPVLREESQHLVRNNAIAGGAVRTNVTKVVGTGLKVKPGIDRELLKIDEETANAWERQAQREFMLATETVEIDLERDLPFSMLQGLAFLKVLEDGDVLVNLPKVTRPGSPYKLKIQLIEAARLWNKDCAPNTAAHLSGVKKDPYGATVEYHVLKQHPAGIYRRVDRKQWQWDVLKAFDSKGQPLAMLLKDKTRPGQTRGVPYLAPVVELIKQLGKYTDAEVMAAVISGMLTVFVTNENGDPRLGPAPTQANPTADPAQQQVDTTGMELGYGSVLGLMPGEKVETVNPGRPNPAFDPFMTAMLRQIGMALELPFEILIKHFTASYSASRAALMEAWDYFRRRRHWLVTSLCQPVYEAVITEAVISGRLKAPGFFADPLVRKAWLGTTWIGDAPYHLDPLKEVNAAEKRMGLLLTTREEEVAAMPQGGSSWIGKVPQLVKEKRIIDENELLPEQPEPAEPADPAGPDGGEPAPGQPDPAETGDSDMEGE